MAKTHTIHARHIICAKLKSEWEQSANANLVPLKGEFCLEINDTELAKQEPDLNEVFKLKVGDGTSKYSELPYLFTTKTEIVNLITTEINKLDVAAYAQATYNTTTKELVIKGIKEVDGKIEADSTNNVTVDLSPSAIAPVQSVVGVTNNPVSVSTSNNVVTVEHDTKTITSDTSTLSFGGTFTADSDTDSFGHVSKKTTFTMPSVVGDNTWTEATTSNNEVTISHIGPDTSNGDNALASSGTNVVTGLGVDAKGHINAAPTIKTITEGTKIDISNNSDSITITHETTTRSDTAQTGNMAFGTAVVTGVTTDTTGHVTGVTTKAIPTDPTVIAAHSEDDTDKGITVEVTTTNAQVSGVDVSVDISTLSQELGLSGAMHFIGVSTTAITDGGTEDPTIAGYTGTAKTPGNVVLYGGQEFVWTGTAWELLGDEGSYALKTRSISVGDELTGGGTLEADRTINHAEKLGSTKAGSYGPTQSSATTLTDGTKFKVPKYTVNKYGHITDVSEIEFTASDHTYTVNEGDLTIQGSGTTVATFNANDANDVNLNITGSGATTVTAGTNEITISSTDQTVDSAVHHYTPTADQSSVLDVNAGGATASENLDVVTGITISRDAKGHITALNIDSGKVPSIPDAANDGELSIKAHGTEAIDFTADQATNESLDISGDGDGTGAIGAIEVSTPSEGNILISAKTGTISQKGVVQLVDTYTSNNNTDNTKATTNKSIKAAIDDLDVSATTLNGIEHITSISETDGKISVSKDTIQSASTTQSGITQYVEDIHYSRDTAKTANAKQIWDECEKRNVQFVKSGIIPVPQPYNEETFINSFAYGIKWRYNTSTVYSVGNSEYIRTQPIHNSLRACIYKINYVSGGFDVTETVGGTSYTIHYGARREFLYWLDDNNWNKKADGTASVLDGTGDTGIAIYHPAFYGKTFAKTENGHTWNYVYISPFKYDDTWDTIKEGYTDFAKASIVNNVARCYSGILPSVSIPRMPMNEYALASGGHQMSYDEYKWLFCWLPIIDFKTFEIESNDIPTTWSWGSDVVDRDSLTGNSIPSYGYPMLYSSSTLGYNYITSGFTNALGTHTGWVKYTNAGYSANVLPAARWRGFEIQRCNWTNVQGCWGEQTDSVDTIFATKNRALFSAYKNPNGYYSPYGEWGCITDMSGNELAVDSQINNETWSLDTTDGLWKSTSYKTKDKNIRYVGKQVGGWITEFGLNSCGDIISEAAGHTKYDYSYTNNVMTPGYYNNPRCLFFGGNARDGSRGGPGCLGSSAVAALADGDIAFRVCWNVDEYTSVMN